MVYDAPELGERRGGCLAPFAFYVAIRALPHGRWTFLGGNPGALPVNQRANAERIVARINSAMAGEYKAKVW